MSQRTQRIADLVRAELSELIRREVRDPRVALVTLSRVEVSSDLSYANIQVSVLGADAERAAALAGLQSARGFLRRQLAHTLSLRVTPELRFFLDRGAEHSQRITELLEDLHGDDRHDS